ncbi:TPA: hypothetical protein ACGO1Y_001019 [Streptococcus suis]
MEAQSLVSHQHSWWFSCFSLREKLARSHNKNKTLLTGNVIKLTNLSQNVMG